MLGFIVVHLQLSLKFDFFELKLVWEFNIGNGKKEKNKTISGPNSSPRPSSPFPLRSSPLISLPENDAPGPTLGLLGDSMRFVLGSLDVGARMSALCPSPGASRSCGVRLQPSTPRGSGRRASLLHPSVLRSGRATGQSPPCGVPLPEPSLPGAIDIVAAAEEISNKLNPRFPSSAQLRISILDFVSSSYPTLLPLSRRLELGSRQVSGVPQYSRQCTGIVGPSNLSKALMRIQARASGRYVLGAPVVRGAESHSHAVLVGVGSRGRGVAAHPCAPWPPIDR